MKVSVYLYNGSHVEFNSADCTVRVYRGLDKISEAQLDTDDITDLASVIGEMEKVCNSIR